MYYWAAASVSIVCSFVFSSIRCHGDLPWYPSWSFLGVFILLDATCKLSIFIHSRTVSEHKIDSKSFAGQRTWQGTIASAKIACSCDGMEFDILSHFESISCLKLVEERVNYMYMGSIEEA